MADKIEIAIEISDNGAEAKLGGIKSALGGVATTAAGFVTAQALTDLPGQLLGMAQAAADDQASVDRLKTAVENSGTSWASMSDQINQAISDGQKKAFTDDDTRNALTLLTSETGSSEEALKRLSVAQDLARGTGMDLGTAAKLLGKVSDDNTSVLARYGIQVGKNATAQDLMNAVDGKFKGQAATFAASDAGKMAMMTDKVSELKEQIGYFLIPILSLLLTVGMRVTDVFATQIVPSINKVIAAVTPLVQFLAAHLVPTLIVITPLLAGAAVVIGTAIVSAFIAWATATWAQVAAFIALNASMLPWIALLAAIGVAVLALYEAWTHNFLGIQDITKTVIAWLQENVLPVLQAIWDGVLAGITILHDTWVAIWPTLSEAINIMVTLIQGYFTSLEGVFQVLWSVFSGIVKLFIDLIHGDWSGAWDDAKGIVSGVIDGISTILSGLPAMVLGYVTDMAGQMLSALGTLVTDAGGKAGEIATAIVNGIKTIVTDGPQKVADMELAMLEKLGDLLIKSGLKAGDVAVAILDGLKSIVTGGPGKIWDMHLAMVQKIGEVATAIVSEGAKIGAAVLSGIASGLADFVSSGLDAAISAVADHIPGWLKKLWGIASPAAAFVPIGHAVAQGIAAGFASGTNAILDAAGKAGTMTAGAYGAGAYGAMRPRLQVAAASSGPAFIHTGGGGASGGASVLPSALPGGHAPTLDYANHPLVKAIEAGAARGVARGLAGGL